MPLSLTEKRWICHKNRQVFPAFVDCILDERNLRSPPPLNTPIMFHRGPEAMKRIQCAIEHHERIGIFGDYDCDGITASALMIRFFRRKGIYPFALLPTRDEGYGLHKEQIDVFRAQEVSLLITVDTGITASAEVEYARAHRIDVIIIDHHTLPPSLPPASAILHPLLADPPILPEPSAVGLCYFLIRLLEEHEWEGHETDLALTSLGTVADLVELRGLNRTLVREGLKIWNRLPSGPLAQLKTSATLHRRISSTDLAFRLAPRVNAAGRIGDPSIALTALLEGGPPIQTLEQLNVERQRYTEEAYQTIAGLTPTPCMCIAHEQYHPGIIGLLAGKITERFGRPSLVASIRSGICTGSLRSIPTLNIMDALTSAKALLMNFGGHAQAAGCTFDHNNFNRLRETLSHYVSQTIPLSDLTPSLSIDAELSTDDITVALCTDLRSLEPFGKGNPEPRFLLRNIHPLSPRCIGSDATHLQFWIENIPVVGFGLGQLLPHLTNPLDLVCRLGINDWNGRKNPQILIDDLRLSKNSCPNERVSRTPLVEDSI